MPRWESFEQRLAAHTDKTGGPESCWPWVGSVNDAGYPRIHAEGRSRRASQVAWELANGRAFPSGMEACHRCNNRRCVNPAHIYAGTRTDNMQDAVRSGTHRAAPAKSHCIRGHEYAGDNVGFGTKGRYCRACKALLERGYARRREAERMARRMMEKVA